MRLIAFFLLVATAGGFAKPLSTSEVAGVLAGLARRRGDSGLTASFREERHIALMNKPVVESGVLKYLPPDKFLRQVNDPVRTLTVSDGEMLWMYFPEQNEVERYPLAGNRALRDSMSALTAALGLENPDRLFILSGEAIADGGHRLVLIPRRGTLRESVSAIRVQLRSDLSLETVTIDTPGGNRSVIFIRDEQAARLTPGDFRFSPPPGTRVSAPLGN